MEIKQTKQRYLSFFFIKIIVITLGITSPVKTHAEKKAGKITVFSTNLKTQNIGKNEKFERIVSSATKSFFTKIFAGDVEKAYKEILQDSTLNRDVVAKKLIKDTKEAIINYGKFSEYELITIKTFGTRLMKTEYIIYSDYQPLLWSFYWYNGTSTSEKWRLLDLRVNDDIKQVFD